MDIKKKLKNVEKKIASLTEDFTEEETFLISTDSKLLKEYVTALAKDSNIWQRHNVIISNSLSIDYLTEEELNVVIENLLFSYYKRNNVLNFSFIDDIVKAFSCSSNTKNYIARKLSDIILSGKYNLCNNCDTYAMAILLKNDKKSIIANIKSLDSKISDKLLEKYYYYCVLNNILPIICHNSNYLDITIKYLDYFSIDSLLNFMLDKNIKLSEEKRLKIYNKILEKIKTSSNIEIATSLDNLSFYIPIDRANNIYKALYDKDYLLHADILIKNKIISKEDFRLKFKNYCLSNKKLSEEVLKRYHNYLNDKEIVMHLPKTNQIQFLFLKELTNIYNKNKEKILTELEKNKKIKELLNECSFNNICQNPSLTLELAKKGFIDTLKCDCTDLNITKEDIKLLDKLIQNYQIKLIIDIKPKSTTRNPFILKALLKNNYLKEFIYLTDNNSDNIKNNIEEIIEYLNKDLIALQKFTKKFIIFIINNNKLLSFYANNDIYLTELLINRIKELNENTAITSYTKDFYKYFKNNLVKLYKLDEENLDLLYKQYGPGIIEYLDNQNIQKLIKLEKTDLQKILAILPNKEITIEDIISTYRTIKEITIEDIISTYRTIKEYIYSQEKTDEKESFNDLLNAIYNNDEELIEKITYIIDKYFSEELFAELNKKYQLKESGFSYNNHYDLVTFIISKINTSSNKEKYIAMLHLIYDNYLLGKRKVYASENNMIHDLNLTYSYEEKDLTKKIAEYITRNENDQEVLREIIKKLYANNFTKEEISDLVYMLRNSKKESNIPSSTLSKKKKYYSTILEYVNEKDLLIEYKEKLAAEGVIKRIYDLNNLSYLDPIKILSYLNIDSILKLINSDETIYNSLKHLFIESKIHLLPINFKKLFESINISYTEENIAAIINYYQEIYNYEQQNTIKSKKEQLVKITQKINRLIISKKNEEVAKLKIYKKNLEEELIDPNSITVSFIQALLCVESYLAVSSVFSLILTPESARLIKNNQSSSTQNKNEYLKEAIRYTKLLFTRNELSIPSFNRIIKIDNNTSIRAIVGNFTSPSNITHGEMLGSSIRIGGHNNKLLNNIITNKDYCFIELNDTKTTKYLTSFICIRIGNTLIFKDINKSLNENILSNTKLLEIIKLIASILISESKKSSYPIANVITSKTSLFNDDYKTINLHIDENNDYLKNIIDHSNCLILATNSPNDSISINTSNEEIPTYLPARREIRKINNKKILLKYINRVAGIKQILEGVDYRLLKEKNIESEVLFALINDEWYIYVDENYNIYSDCIELDERAKNEFLEELSKVETIVNNLKEDEEKWIA